MSGFGAIGGSHGLVRDRIPHWCDMPFDDGTFLQRCGHCLGVFERNLNSDGQCICSECGHESYDLAKSTVPPEVLWITDGLKL